MNRISSLVICLAIVGLALSGCGKKTESGSSETSSSGTTPAVHTDSASTSAAAGAASSSAAVERHGKLVIVNITGNDQMQYDIHEFTVNAGDSVRVVLKHIGTMPAATMGHNVVILKAGEDVQKFGAEVIAGGGNLENSYLPPSMVSRVVAHTKTIGGGETTQVEFVAPAAGEYPYMCTFPGHFALMHGKMTVQ